MSIVLVGRGRAATALAALAVLAAATACADEPVGGQSAAVSHAPVRQTTPQPKIPLGHGLVAFPDAASAWVRAHPGDPRTALIAKRIAGRPSSLWLTGNSSFGNLREDAALAKSGDRTMLLTLWNIPLRYDGLSTPSTISPAAYQAWVSKVATGLRGNRAIVVLEPDALWFYDRLPSDHARRVRLAALKYAVSTLRAKDPRVHVYLDAGTSSGSVTPRRMATLLVAAGIKKAAGYAVNVSSYSPTSTIQAYAQAIRSALKARGIRDPRYVIDTGRNGAASWDNDWCNPPQQRLGTKPTTVRGGGGLDFDLWIKAPGTSDGDCGTAGAGLESYGGEFLPQLAYRMAGG